LVAIVIIGMLVVAVRQRNFGAQERARIGVASTDVDLYRQALGMFELDYDDFPAALTLANAPAVLVDPQGDPYMPLLPVGNNFATFLYIRTHVGATMTPSYELEITCKDAAGTVLQATPQGVRKR